ncbi:hypothetical protein [Nannocystis pusilla]|uniref:hypothetical protein n=1 Tax=Nannocystis pusilla TaxID=889268 RepID=UPI003B7A160E
MSQRAGQLARVIAAVWRISLAEAIAYRVSMLMWVLTTTFPLVSLALWSGLAAGARSATTPARTSWRTSWRRS